MSARAAPDPINLADLGWMGARARQLHAELVASLAAERQQLLAPVPFVVEDTPEVNAYAACVGGKPLVSVTVGLLDICAQLARAKASDEVFATRRLDAYLEMVARSQKPGAPPLRPPPGFFPPGQDSDGRKLERQHQLFDEQVAAALAHELAHHYLGHLPCTGNAGPLGAAELGRALSTAAPVFNQPNELAADVEGIQHVLATGARHHGYQWTEAGSLLTMQLFSTLDRLSVADVVFAFERSHPPPAVRTPVIVQAASWWRSGAPRLIWPLGTPAP